MADYIHKPTACIYLNDKFFYIIAYSGYGLLIMDPEAPPHLLPINTDLKTLAEVILRSLQESRLIPLEIFDEVKKKLDPARTRWVNDVCKQYGFKNKNQIFTKMAACSVRYNLDKLIFMPRHHEKLEGWTSTHRGEADYIIISADSPPEKIGEAMWQALRRCTGRRPDILAQE